jgi:protection-of-telomeres protein 1
VQNWSGTESLVTHHSSTLHVYSSKAIPKPPRSARGALLSAKKGSRVPTDAEHTYVSWFYHNVDKDAIPDEASFQHAVTESLNIKDKFGLLRDVVEGRFYDLLVRAVRDPFPSGDKVTLYATDYTENPNFFDSPASGPGDPYGYTRREGQSAEWVGPPGRRSIQITCYEPHATVVQEELRAGGWASLRNVHIKYGSNNLHLEGYMRGEQGLVHQGRVNVAVHDFNNSEVELDQRSKDALRRWREFEKSRKKQGKEEVQPNGSNTKRKADGEGAGARPNSKQRRKLKRLEAEKKAKEDEARAKMQRFAVEDELELNSYSKWTRFIILLLQAPLNNGPVRCEGRSLDPTTIAEIAQLIDYETTVNGVMKTLKLPFINAKHKTIARVTDFRPDRLEDFACSRKHTPWDLLSDNSADSTSDSSESDEDLAGSGPRIWEWHFALQLEDPSSKVKPPPRIWVLVDNAEAQLLTDLDASK